MSSADAEAVILNKARARKAVSIKVVSRMGRSPVFGEAGLADSLITRHTPACEPVREHVHECVTRAKADCSCNSYRKAATSKPMSSDQKSAAVIAIGDELLSGRTRDANLHYLAGWLTARGINLREARVQSRDYRPKEKGQEPTYINRKSQFLNTFDPKIKL